MTTGISLRLKLNRRTLRRSELILFHQACRHPSIRPEKYSFSK